MKKVDEDLYHKPIKILLKTVNKKIKCLIIFKFFSRNNYFARFILI